MVKLLVILWLLTSLLTPSLTDADNEVSSDRKVNGHVPLGKLRRNRRAKVTKYNLINMGYKIKARTASICLKKCAIQNWRMYNNITTWHKGNDCRFVQWRHNGNWISTKRRRQCWLLYDYEPTTVKKNQGWTLGILSEAAMPILGRK